MDYSKYRELTNLIDAYLNTGDRERLATIQECIATNKDYREELITDLRRGYNSKYIKVFSTDDQVKIVSDWVAQIKQEEYLAYPVSWMLPYVSGKALDQILSKADDVALVKIMHEIKGNIRAVGHRFCDSSTYFWFHTTNVFSRMEERRRWRKLYKKCKKSLKG